MATEPPEQWDDPDALDGPCEHYGPWATPEELRRRPDADRIVAFKVLSGRSAPITDSYWDTCVIEVPYEVREA